MPADTHSPRTGNWGLPSSGKHPIINEMQTAIARELARHCQVPTTLPPRIADLLRQLHRQLRNPDQEPS